MRAVAALLAGSGILSLACHARPAERDYAASIIPDLGVGVGNFGLAARTGVSADFWLSRSVGLGAALGGVAQLQVFGRSGAAWFAGPELALRMYPNDSGFWLFTVAAGYARNSVTTPIPCVPPSSGEPAPPPGSSGSQLCLVSAGTSTERSHGAFGSLRFGYVSDEGRVLQPGVALRADAIGWPSTGDATPQLVATLNFMLGFKL